MDDFLEILAGIPCPPNPYFFNPFAGKNEPFLGELAAYKTLVKEAANRINELQEEIRAIKAHLVIE